MKKALLILILLTACNPVIAAPLETVRREQASFTLAAGYEINCFASEKDGIANPVTMRWDARGRLWVLCSQSYPQLFPSHSANDKLIILEDSDGDGVADKSTVFVDGLNMPMGLALGDGGVYIGEGTDLIHLRDTDGDDKADTRRVVFTGFGTGDTHQNLNSFTWTPGGELLFNQGLHCFSRVETPWGIKRLDEDGSWRFRPKRLQLHSYNGTIPGGNPWGFAIGNWGEPFIKSNGPEIGELIPVLVQNARRVGQGRNTIGRTPTKSMIAEIVDSPHFPDDIQGNFLIAGYKTRTIERMTLEPHGSGHRTSTKSGAGPTTVEAFLACADVSFRPVDIETGPDGAIYISDWYNPVITHYQRSYRHPDRDDEHGRIWRVTATGRPLLKKPTLTGLSTAQLVKRLESPVRWERRMVRQLLRDVDTDDLVASVYAWLNADAQIGDHEIFKALSVLESAEHVDEALLRRLLSVKDYRGRAYAARVAGRWSDRLKDPLALLEICVQDEHPRVRLEAIVAASDSQDPQAIKVILQSLDKPVDHFIQTALRCTVVGFQDRWKPALLKGELKFDNPQHLAFLLKTSGATGIGDQVRKLIDSEDLDQAGRDGLRVVLAGIGNAADLRRVFDSGAKNPDVLAALDTAARTRNIKPSGSLGPSLLRLIEEGDNRLRVEALHLAASWQLGELAKPAGQIMKNPKESAEVRVAAVGAFARLDAQATAALTKLLQNTKELAAVQVAAVEALAVSDIEVAARYAVEFLHADRGRDSVRAMVIPFLGRRTGDEKLAAALAANPPSKKMAMSVRSALIALGRHSPALDKVLMPSLSADAVGMPTYNRDYVANLAKDAAEHGNAANGAKVYTSAALNCIACHRIDSSGGVVGPDLTGIGAGMRPDMIIESVLWPKRQVKEGYMATTLVSNDDRIVSGYIQSEDNKKVVIRNVADGTLTTYQKNNIKERQDAGSLMPPGITASLDTTELRDLIKYLSNLKSKSFNKTSANENVKGKE